MTTTSASPDQVLNELLNQCVRAACDTAATLENLTPGATFSSVRFSDDLETEGEAVCFVRLRDHLGREKLLIENWLQHRPLNNDGEIVPRDPVRIGQILLDDEEVELLRETLGHGAKEERSARREEYLRKLELRKQPRPGDVWEKTARMGKVLRREVAGTSFGVTYRDQDGRTVNCCKSTWERWTLDATLAKRGEA